jgi:aspartyl-tRNA(Asn)/glutamyl-tRNA(Gln) amidotransferase subunit A
MGFIKQSSISSAVNKGVMELVDQLRSGAVSAVELVEAYAHMIEHDQCNAVVVKTLEQARAQAREADERLRSGQARKLEGVPFISKQVFCAAGALSDASSRILSNFISPYDATVIAHLRAEGAIMLGSSNMDEFAMGSTTKNSYHGPTLNPWISDAVGAHNLIPGGSSGGSAAAVASGLAPFALGSDTGGSVRQPASLCGVVGFKPTYGLCSRYGMIAFASSLDQAGVLTRNVQDAAYVMSIMAGHDEKDATSAKMEIPPYHELLNSDVRGLKIGIPLEYRSAVDPETDRAWTMTMDILKARGAEIVDISLPNVMQSIPVYYVLVCAEASSNLARYDGIRYGAMVKRENGMTLEDYYRAVRSDNFGDEVKRRIVLGTYCLQQVHNGISLYEHARAVRALINREFLAAFAKVDAILCPTTVGSAYPADRPMDPIAVYYSDIFAAPVNLCGCPGISVPVSLNSEGLPLGMQVMGKRFDEQTMLNIAKAIEEAVDFRLPEVGVQPHQPTFSNNK